MRVLCSCVPGFGHFHPMVPLARALQRVGHEVAFATAERFCRRVVEPAGFTAFAAGISPAVAYEETLDLSAGSREDSWSFGARMFAQVSAPAKVAALVQIVQSWQADVVIHDMTDFAAPVAAARGGVPWAGHTFGSLPPQELWDAAARFIEPTWRAWDLAAEPAGGMFRHLYFDICPPSFQADLAGQEVAQPLRPVSAERPEDQELPSWADDLAPGPTVYVTLGTVVNHTPLVFETVLGGLADHVANVIVTVGPDRDPGELGPQPANVHVEAYLPHSVLLPRCDLVVCHGGSGTALASLSSGLPLLVLPQEANQFWNADRIARLGAGELLRPDQLSAEAVRATALRVLDDPSYKLQALRVAAEIAAMPAPDDVVDLIGGFVRAYHQGR